VFYAVQFGLPGIRARRLFAPFSTTFTIQEMEGFGEEFVPAFSGYFCHMHLRGLQLTSHQTSIVWLRFGRSKALLKCTVFDRLKPGGFSPPPKIAYAQLSVELRYLSYIDKFTTDFYNKYHHFVLPFQGLLRGFPVRLSALQKLNINPTNSGNFLRVDPSPTYRISSGKRMRYNAIAAKNELRDAFSLRYRNLKPEKTLKEKKLASRGAKRGGGRKTDCREYQVVLTAVRHLRPRGHRSRVGALN
jgi:hypothetical protein